ncbi:MAG: ATP-binding cassette domain-containing protein [Salinisphaera sp.]|jgi:ABC-2 type transport system ATP-binding protein|nr:ATP-binding cassette domain-containing protein [Salinisphaera sp.]
MAHEEHSDLLRAQGLCRDYAGSRVVHDVEISLAGGDVLGVLGPNGAGKTTILRMLAGTLAPSAGRICIAGADLRENPIAAKRHIGYLPERPPVYSELTVDEYLGFCARLHGIVRAKQRAAIAAAKADCELEAVGKRPISHLSKGFQQRVGIAQAIVHRPDVLILDEPTAGLDPNQLRGVRALIARLAADHSVIVSSHILPEIQAVASRVMIVNAGRIVLDAPMTDLDGQATALEVGFAASPDAATLGEQSGVTSVEAISPGRWLLTLDPTHADIRVALAERAAADGWQLNLLSPRSVTLEDRFLRLTSGDSSDCMPDETP